MHFDGAPVRTCVLPVGAAQGRQITTIEGLSRNTSHPVQKAWIALDVPQCGYCQSGMIMAAAALLKQHPQPTDQDIDGAMTNLCRCASYARIRARSISRPRTARTLLIRYRRRQSVADKSRSSC